MRVRGLKQLVKLNALRHLLVAPHAGAWIETTAKIGIVNGKTSRTPCGCVD